MTRRWAHVLYAAMALSLVACESDRATSNGPTSQGDFRRYVAMGTSISMGVQNGDNAVLYTTQLTSWPSQLARQAGAANFNLPLLKGPGCFPPLIAPLALSRTLNSTPPGDTTCAGLLFGTPAPSAGFVANNVAISGATTIYADSLTPELAVSGSAPGNTSSVFRGKAYPLILPPGKTQVTAMLQQNPTFVSVELGANDVLSTVSGVAIPGATFVPYAAWQPVYDRIIDRVASTGAKAILVTVPNVSNIIAMRTGAELFADSVAFRTNYKVNISSNCAGSPNLVFTSLKVTGTVSAASRSPTPLTLSCADAPGTQDFVLTPSEVAVVTATVNEMNAHITDLATARGWALLDANQVLAEFVSLKPAYSVVKQLTCVLPYGQFIGLDGVHPNAAGQTKIANAAIVAINAKFGFDIPLVGITNVLPAAVCP